jgi:hypothetical protein
MERLWWAAGAVALGIGLLALPTALRADAARASALPYKASGKLPRSPAYLHLPEAVSLVQQATDADDYIVTDHGMVAFRSGRPVPPGLCVISGKRIGVGELTAEDLVQQTEAYEAAAVLFWNGDRLTREPLSPFARYVEEHFELYGEIDDAFRLYVRQPRDRDGPEPQGRPSP